MTLELIKELHEITRKKSDAEKALAEAGIDFDLNNGEEKSLSFTDNGDEDFSFTGEEEDIDPELQRLADDLRDQSEEMEDDDLEDLIGDQLEQLEYQPDEMYNAIRDIMKYLGREVEDEEYEDDFDDDFEDEDEFKDEDELV